MRFQRILELICHNWLKKVSVIRIGIVYGVGNFGLALIRVHLNYFCNFQIMSNSHLIVKIEIELFPVRIRAAIIIGCTRRACLYVHSSSNSSDRWPDWRNPRWIRRNCRVHPDEIVRWIHRVYLATGDLWHFFEIDSFYFFRRVGNNSFEESFVWAFCVFSIW